MPEETKLRIESIAENNWRALVGEALEEIYGENIINYSAKGKGPDSRPAIDHRVFKGLFRKYYYLLLIVHPANIQYLTDL